MTMGEFSPEVARRISRLRWTAGLLWIIWTILAVPIYLVFQRFPVLFALPGVAVGAISILALASVWFIYLIYRMGELARGAGVE
jgi:hypothetical protein